MVANKKFDIDLKYGQLREKKVHDIALEYECNGKPSGINATESDYWIHILAKGNKNHCMLVFEVKELKKIVKKYKEQYTRMVGDRNASKCVILPIRKLFDVEVN